MHRLQELLRLHRSGRRSREIARLLQMGRNTVREYRQALLKAELLDGSTDSIPELEVLKAAVKEHDPPVMPAQQVSSVAQKSAAGVWRPGRVGPRTSPTALLF